MLVLREGKNYSIGTTCGLSKIPQEFLSLPFSRIIEAILNKKTEVSITFIRESKMKELNHKFRKVNKSTDILSFEDTNEILFSINDVRKKATSYQLPVTSYLSYLLIHGLLHLKGMAHSSKMDSKERKFCQKFKIIFPFSQKTSKNKKDEKADNSRNRHRDLRSKGYSSV